MERFSLSEADVRRFLEVQLKLSKRVVIRELLDEHFDLIAGMDVTYIDDVAMGVLVVFDANLHVVAVYSSEKRVTFPYIPGLLAFRELPVLLECFIKAKRDDNIPDLVFLDGQGIAHPRRIGIASHFGILTNLPTIGVAKKRLYGICRREVLPGCAEPLLDRDGEILGYCYVHKPRTAPIYISPGHLCDPESALRITLRMFKGYKLPEPIRIAHQYTQLIRVEKLKKGL